MIHLTEDASQTKDRDSEPVNSALISFVIYFLTDTYDI